MAEKPSSPASDLAELVTCSICLESFKDARALPCLHSYCKECLQGLVTSQGKITCPHCRLEVEVPNGDASNLNPNFFVNNVMDVLNSTSDALTWDKNETSSATCCRSHPDKECELFCQHCSQLICYKCISNWGTCGQHSYESIATVVKISRENVQDVLRRKEELLPSVITHGVILADMKAKQSENIIDVSKQISDTFAMHMESLKQRQDTLIQQAFDMQWQNDDGLSSEIDRVQLEQAKIENTIEFCRRILDVADPVLFLQMYIQVKDKVFKTDSQELVSHVELGGLRFQATDSLLADVILNFGNVVSSDEACAAEEEKPVRAEQPPLKQRRLPTSERPANKQQPDRPDGPHAGNVLAEQETTAKPASWKLYNKHYAIPEVTFEDKGLSVKTKSLKNVAVFGKPGFKKGKHSWKIRATGFPDGLGIGICVGSNGRGIVVTFDSGLTYFRNAIDIHVELDCDAKKLSVLPDGYQNPEILGFENPANLEVHPYFSLPPPNRFSCNKITIMNIDGNSVENNESCCIL